VPACEWDIPPQSDAEYGTTDAWADLIEGCWAPDPTDRFTVEHISEVLDGDGFERLPAVFAMLRSGAKEA
jgi:hypothetical protein